MTTTNRATKLKCSFSTTEAIGNAILWIILIVVALGLALVVFSYARDPLPFRNGVSERGGTLRRDWLKRSVQPCSKRSQHCHMRQCEGATR